MEESLPCVITAESLEYPNMHDELAQYISFLADFNYQKVEWTRADPPENTIIFDYIVHFLFDDTHLARDVDECIGVLIRNADEAAHSRAVVEAINVVFARHGLRMTDAEYIAVPEWPAVVAASAAALVVLTAPDEAGLPGDVGG